MKEKTKKKIAITVSMEERCTKGWTMGGGTESGPPFCSRARLFWLFRDTLKDRCIEPVDVLLGLSAVH